MANIELMRKLRTRFLRMRHPKHFNMDVIAMKTDCGAVLCIAGHTLELAGYKKRLTKDYKEYDHRNPHLWLGRQDFDFIHPSSGRRVQNALATAARELGLNYRGRNATAFNLFHDFSLKTPLQAVTRIDDLIAKYQRDAS